MIIYLYEGYDDSYIIAQSNDKRFKNAWGKIYRIQANNLYKDLKNLSTWGLFELGEEISFEVG